MALKACWRFSGVIPRILLNKNVSPVTRAWTRSLSNTLGTRTGCNVTYSPCPNRGWFRNFSSSLPEINVSYDQLKKILAAQKSAIIDVREPWELREYGNIPGSINVPLGQVGVALQLAPEEFRERFGGEMPRVTDHVVFSCLAGVRSKKALDSAVALGYTDVQHYPGGWQEWAELEQRK